VQPTDHEIKKGYKKFRETKKLGCSAKVYVYENITFPEFKVSTVCSVEVIKEV
jgi:hypothetical protein